MLPEMIRRAGIRSGSAAASKCHPGRRGARAPCRGGASARPTEGRDAPWPASCFAVLVCGEHSLVGHQRPPVRVLGERGINPLEPIRHPQVVLVNEGDQLGRASAGRRCARTRRRGCRPVGSPAVATDDSPRPRRCRLWTRRRLTITSSRLSVWRRIDSRVSARVSAPLYGYARDARSPVANRDLPSRMRRSSRPLSSTLPRSIIGKAGLEGPSERLNRCTCDREHSRFDHVRSAYS